MARRVGILGGTFDPIHIGHLVAGDQACEQLNLDEVVFVTAGDPWQKSDHELSPAQHRLAMVNLAVADHPTFVSSAIEVNRPGPTYSIDTVRELSAGSTDLFFILGEDAFAGIDSWHEAEQLKSLVHFAVCTRPGSPDRLLNDHSTVVPIPELDVSSTIVRDYVRSGRSIRFLTPEPVIRYIHDHKLYRDDA